MTCGVRTFEERVNNEYDELSRAGAMNPTLHIIYNEAPDLHRSPTGVPRSTRVEPRQHPAAIPKRPTSRRRKAAEGLAETACARAWAEANPDRLLYPMKA